MDKEIITRTSGKRLGYVNQLYVDPVRLEVVAVYLRTSPGIPSLGAASSEHVLLSSLRQIGDVVLVHDESALLDPPADETYGYLKLVGTEVQTEDGIGLGKVRDFVFNPDNGQVASVRYDALGIPSIPQALLSCYSISWEDIVAVGPTKTIVRRCALRHPTPKLLPRPGFAWTPAEVCNICRFAGAPSGAPSRRTTAG
jgi:sporulation protein YlmC with PRC-barrel domain